MGAESSGKRPDKSRPLPVVPAKLVKKIVKGYGRSPQG